MGLRKKKSLLDQVRDQASDYVDAAKPHVEAAFEASRDFVQDTAVPALIDAKDKAAPVLADARDKATPVIASGVALAGAKASDARDKAAPVLADARDRAREAATSRTAPLIASGQALASEKATAAKTLADAKVAQLKGEPAPTKGSKLKKLVLFTAVAGAVAFVAKKLQGGKAESNNWQSSYVPTPPPASAPSPAQAAAPAAAATSGDDTGGSSPDEAFADLAEAPHPVTTPDEPVEVVEIEDPRA